MKLESNLREEKERMLLLPLQFGQLFVWRIEHRQNTESKGRETKAIRDQSIPLGVLFLFVIISPSAAAAAASGKALLSCFLSSSFSSSS